MQIKAIIIFILNLNYFEKTSFKTYKNKYSNKLKKFLKVINFYQDFNYKDITNFFKKNKFI